MRAIRFDFVVAAILTSAALPLPVAAATEQVLYQFGLPRDGYPQAPLYFSNSILMGEGSSYLGPGNTTYGAIFELVPSNGTWNEKDILRFDGANGSNPFGGLTEDSAGALYGTTFLGGTYGEGTAFRLARTARGWTEKTYSFGSGTSDGIGPESNLIMDQSGALYGTTLLGGAYGSGYGYGTVFKLTYSHDNWSETILHSFGGGKGDGVAPPAGLLRIGKETFFGTTEFGGSSTPGCGGTAGCGTVFEISPSKGGWKETVLHDFDNSSTDGGEPVAGLIKDAAGNLYGTTSEGGIFSNEYCSGTCGTVFELTQSGGVWTEKVIYKFSGPDGAFPSAGLLLSGSGALYGTTWGGGTYGAGAVFELTQSGGVWSETVLYSFVFDGPGGYEPLSALIADKNGNLYGTTMVGGDLSGKCWRHGGCGVVYEITP